MQPCSVAGGTGGLAPRGQNWRRRHANKTANVSDHLSQSKGDGHDWGNVPGLCECGELSDHQDVPQATDRIVHVCH